MNKQISILILGSLVSGTAQGMELEGEQVTPVKKTTTGQGRVALQQADHDAPTPVHSVMYRMRSGKVRKKADTAPRAADGVGEADQVRSNRVRTVGSDPKGHRFIREGASDNRLHDLVRKSTCSAIAQLMDEGVYEGASSEVGPCDVNGRDPFGYTALYYAVKKNKVDIVQLLVEGYKADTSLTFDGGLTFLDKAIDKGHVAIAKFLSLYIPLHIENENGELPLIRAIKQKKDAVVAALLQPDYRFIMVLQSKDHKTAYNLALELGNVKLAAHLRALAESPTDKDEQLKAVHDEYQHALAKATRALEKAQLEISQVTETDKKEKSGIEAFLFQAAPVFVGVGVLWFVFKLGQNSSIKAE